MDGNLQSIVLLIDADNTMLSKLELVIREVSTQGRIVVKRAYGNWKKDNLKKWEEEVKRLAINAIQQFDYVAGKNATDMALVIDAMELLYRNIYDGFVIVSSDSDYTPLAIKLHESGVYVIGVGKENTPEAFRNACDEFVFLENLHSSDLSREEAEPAPEPAQQAAAIRRPKDSAAEKKRQMKEIHELLKIAHEKYQDEEGYTHIGAAGSYIKRAKPDFDSRTYGFVKLSQLIEAFPEKYELIKEKGKGSSSILFYRCL